MDSHLMIRVLGPIDLLTEAGAVPIGSKQVRALLGALVISARHSASVDYLSGVLWGQQQPAGADNTLQSYVSRLRRLLGPETIQREDHSYQLVVDTNQLDAGRFEHLLIQATELHDDPARRKELCRQALSLWRGTPFGELCDEEPFRLEALRLDELRLAAMELSLEAELALGRHWLAVGELENAVEEYPYRERFWYLLIEALIQGGRRVEALRMCSRLREVLAGVGLAGEGSLTELEDRILSEAGPNLGGARTFHHAD